MEHRQIIITVDFDMRQFRNNEITPKQKVKEMVKEEMVENFSCDEGYLGVKVEVNDET